ncbi:hypothetical protein D3Z38_18860 [Clostridiales bacterium]|nr:hypothetical protein [Clostridiales bacterium]
MKALYMAVTADGHELPVAVCENAKELAEKFRMDPKRVRDYVCRGSIRKKDGVKFVRVEA